MRRKRYPLICVLCGWRTRRTMGSCEFDGHYHCACYFGHCRKCNHTLMPLDEWQRAVALSKDEAQTSVPPSRLFATASTAAIARSRSAWE